MTTPVRLALLCLALVLLLGLGAWYYLFGPNKVDSAELVPAGTVAFFSVPNAARIVVDYQTSHLKELVEAPEAKPLLDEIKNAVGQKNLDLLQDFLPNLSGQSFVAFTRFDPAHPAHGEIIGLRPKAGTGDFDAFVAKLKATYPGFATEVKSGAGQAEGLDYQWIQGAGIPDADRICTARYRGWIVIAWGEDSLRDWWERIRKKASSPSLAENHDYQESIARVGRDFELLFYLDAHALAGARAGGSALPASAAAVRAFASGTKFEQGEIAEHFSLLVPRSAQADFGLVPTPCPFDTLKFTGPDTRFYWGANFNWAQVWKNLQAQAAQSPPTYLGDLAAHLQNWAQAHNIDVQRNIVGALGGEISAQVEWSPDSSYPDAGLFLKLDHPDDFKPVAAAIVDTMRQEYETRAVVNELTSGDLTFATLKFVQPLPISPTITENAPYFGVFLGETHAVRSFQRDETMGLLKNLDFLRQIGDKRAGASQIAWLDSPRLLDRGYQAALPYLSLAAMFDRTPGGLLQNRNLPPDLHWLAPIGTWAGILSTDDDGLTGSSVSGIGNQGFLFAGSAQMAFRIFPALGAGLNNVISPPAPAPVSTPAPPGAVPAPSNAATNAPAAEPPPPLPPATTNAEPSPAPAMPASSPPTNATPPAPAPAPGQ